ncbi:MAG: Fe-S protein assembly chaperone HscA, partial [Bacteroidetes bacterium]|nr:Fe-S protein assembly chaperone HscA [Bacteroidota bacterium]
MTKISIDLKKAEIVPNDIIIGIDLGTTNSLVALCQGDHRNPVCLDDSSGVIVPSVVYLGHGKMLVGKEAKTYLLTEPEHTIYSVKRLLGRSYKDLRERDAYFGYRIVEDEAADQVRIESNGTYFSPVELSAAILSEVKLRAEKALGATVRKAVITVPAYFDDLQRQATREAGKLAGLEVLRILNEPTAASLAYGLGQSQEQKRLIAVYDFGGGTFDMSILRLEAGVFEVLATRGDTWLGGDDIDRAIMEHWMHQIPEAAQIRQRREQVQQLRLFAEEAKILLSGGSTKTYRREDVIGELPVTLNLNAAELELLCTPILDHTMAIAAQALSDAGLKAEELQEVVLVGGSTRLQLVKDRVRSFFSGVHVNESLNPDEVVALGAAVEADILAGNRRDILLLDVTPLSLGIETLGGLMDVLIPRNSRIPCSAARQYTTSVDGQVNMEISVFQGERELCAQNRKLASFQLKGIPAMPAGLPKIEVRFLIDADGMLKVGAKELRSGIAQEIVVQYQKDLTDKAVEDMLLDSLNNAKTDVETRLLVEARTEAAQLCYTARRFLEKNHGLLSTEEQEKTIALCASLEALTKESDKDAILAGIERLNDYTRPFAERLMDVAVG